MQTLVSLALAVGMSASTPSNAPAPQTTDRKLYTVATAHLDTNWMWTIQTTIREYLPNTLRVNLAYFDKFPDYVFNFEGAIRYMLAKEYYPDLYAKLKRAIAQGRWRVTGSWVDAVDVNVPSPEALIRQTLYGNGFFMREFGKRSVDVFLPDCFGFPYTLPSIAAHCGLKGFSTQKLTWGSAYGIPFTVGAWEGVDGSTIGAALDPGGYGGDVGPDWNRADWLIRRIDAVGAKSGFFADYRYHGTGDTGGGPSVNSLRNLEACIKAGGPITVVSAGGDQLFRDLSPTQLSRLPHYKGELLLTSHGTGCYSSQAAMKHWNRKNELLGAAAERAALMASALGGSYPQAKLNQAWIRFLWHGFHDDLTGTSIPAVYPFSWNDEVLSLNQFSEVLSDSLRTVAHSLDTRVEGVPVVVYNPLAAERADPVRASLRFDGPAPLHVQVIGPGGRAVPAQVERLSGSTADVVFIADTAGLSASVYDVRPGADPSKAESELRVTARSLENSRYRVRLNADGDVVSVFDKAGRRELLRSPIRLAVLNDHPQNWPAWEVSYKDVSSKPLEYVGGPATMQVVESGPARVAIRIRRKAAGSDFDQIVSLAAGASRLEFDNRVNWRCEGRMVKAVFDCASPCPEATYDLGLGTIRRGNDRRQLYEVPAQQWADLSKSDSKFGVSILSESKYGWDKPADDTLRLTLVRTPEAGDGDYQSHNDLGTHRFGFAVYGHAGDWRNGTVAEGERFNQPLIAFQADKAAGKLGRAFSFAQARTPGISVKAVKKAEAGDRWIVRVFETTGRPTKAARIHFGFKLAAVQELNGQEDPLPAKTAAVKVSGNDLVFDMKPYRPRTFAISAAPAAPASAAPISKPLPLPFDSKVVSGRGQTGASLDADGHSIPAELWPAAVTAEGVSYKLGPAAGNDAVVCRGQRIALPPTRTVCVLAASVAGDVQASFKVGSKAVSTQVPYFSGFIGQWTSRLVGGHIEHDPAKFAPAYIKRTPVAWLATHRHDKNGRDEPYVYCYLFKLTFDVPRGAEALTLPNDPRVRVFAVSAVRDPRPALTPGAEMYE